MIIIAISTVRTVMMIVWRWRSDSKDNSDITEALAIWFLDSLHALRHANAVSLELLFSELVGNRLFDGCLAGWLSPS